MSTVERRLFAGLALASVLLVSRGSPALGGDATYYLAVADSIARDGDLDLRNQFAEDGGYVFAADAERSFARVMPDGRLRPSQGVAWSAALAPVLLAARTVAGALPESWLARARWTPERATRDLISVVMAMLAAWTGVLAFRLARRMTAPRRLWMLVALAFATPPLVLASMQATPEVPATLALVWFVSERVRPGGRAWRSALALALLPWLHLRFALVALAGVAWLWRTGDRPAALLPLASLSAACAVTWMTSGVEVTTLPGVVAAAVVAGVLAAPGLLVDLDVGLVWIAPFWLVALAGLRRARSAHPDAARFAMWTAGGLLLMAGMFDNGQPLPPPGMSIAPALPLFVPLLAEGVTAMAAGWRRWTAALLLVWSLVVLVLVADRPRRLLVAPGQGVGRLPEQAADWIAEQRAPATRLARLGFALDQDHLLSAVRGGHRDAVDLFVESGIPLGDALLAAVQSGQAESLARLVRRDAGGPDGARALAWARHFDRGALADLLTGAGAAIDGPSAAGDTALMVAVRKGRADERAVLLGQGARAGLAARSGETALMIAARMGDAQAATDLVAAGADVGAADKDGWTALLYAARFGHTGVMRLLLDAGADPNVRSRTGWTPLMWAANEGVLDAADVLLRAGADVNATSAAGLTPLIRAAAAGHAAVVARLLEGGADTSARIDDRDARAWAADRKQTAVVEILGRGGRQP